MNSFLKFSVVMAVLAYIVSLGLLVAVEFVGSVGMGAQRWLDLGVITIQPSEIAKVTLVMVLAAYYDRLPARRVSHPLWVLLPVILIILPTLLILAQPNLGTALITVVAKKAQLAVTKAVKAGKTLAVNGSLFKPGEKVTLKLKKKGPAKKGTKKAFGSSVTAGPDGTISKGVKLKKAAKGSWKITAKGASSGRTAASGFKVS